MIDFEMKTSEPRKWYWTRCIDISPAGHAMYIVHVYKQVDISTGLWMGAGVWMDNNLDSSYSSMHDFDALYTAAAALKLAARLARNLDKLLPPGTPGERGKEHT